MRYLTLALNVFLLGFAMINDGGSYDARRVRYLAMTISFVLIVAFFLTKDRDWIAEKAKKFLG